MTSEKIESAAVRAVQDVVDNCELLNQYISEKEKEPSWDGHIYAYSNSDNKKENMYGRIPVQVKGKTCEDFSKDEISYPVELADLKNYLDDGGTIFFVVLIDSKKNKRVYYNSLTIIKLRNILSKTKGKKTKNITLKKLPDSKDDVEMIVFNAINHRVKQHSSKDAKLLSLEELKKTGLLRKITIPITTVNGVDVQTALFKSELCAYAKCEGSEVEQPLMEQIHIDSAEAEINADVSIDDVVYYNSYKIAKEPDCQKLIFGDSLAFISNDKDEHIKISYKDSPYVRVSALDLDFFLHFIEKGNIKLGDSTLFRKDLTSFDISEETIEEGKRSLAKTKDIVKVLDLLNYKGDLKPNELDIDSHRKLDMLITALVYDKPVKVKIDDEFPTILINIGELNFLMYYKKVSKDEYKIMDFFRANLEFSYIDRNGERAEACIFEAINKDDYNKIQNIRFEEIYPTIKSVKNHPEKMDRANMLLLSLLYAYDKASERNEILDAANSIAEWIYRTEDEKLPYEYRVINYLQTKKRVRVLTDDEQHKLTDIISNSSDNEVIAASYLLLDQQIAAELAFNKLDAEQQDKIKSYPIYHFWKN